MCGLAEKTKTKKSTPRISVDDCRTYFDKDENGFRDCAKIVMQIAESTEDCYYEYECEQDWRRKEGNGKKVVNSSRHNPKEVSKPPKPGMTDDQPSTMGK